jgi:hypothetical protein
MIYKLCFERTDWSWLSAPIKCLHQGKLPVTMYPHSYLQKLPVMGAHTGTAYSMSEGIGRSYRYISI